MITKQEINACTKIIDAVADVYVGDRDILKRLLAGALANGHVLFEDDPGLGKTLLAKTFASAIGARSTRIQFTPDLLPADVLGTRVWNAEGRRFELVRGPVFTNVLLADEINRAPPKTQSALLEAMEERQVTLDAETLDLSKDAQGNDTPFFVLATQNPLEQEGTYPLPEAQLDRFLLRLHTGYPATRDAEMQILKRRLGWKRDDPTHSLAPVVTLPQFMAMQREVEHVYVHESILAYIADLVRGVRAHTSVAAGPSPRGALALLKGGRALAYVNGRDFVTPDDVKRILVDALAHRVVLEADAALDGADARALVLEASADVQAPTRYGRSETATAPLVRT